MEMAIVPSSEISKIESKINLFIKEVEAYEIQSHDDLNFANEQRKKMKGVIEEIGKIFDESCELTDKAHKGAVALRKRFLDPAKWIDRTWQDKMGNWQMAEKKRIEDEETKRLETAKKEQEKILAQAAKKIDDLLNKSTDIQTQINSLTEALNTCTDDTEATAIRGKLEIFISKKNKIEEGIQAKAQEAEQIKYDPPPVAIFQEKPKPAGMSFKIVKEGVVIDKIAVIKAVATGVLPHDLLEVNQGVLDKLLNAGIVISGVRVQEKPKVSTRR